MRARNTAPQLFRTRKPHSYSVTIFLSTVSFQSAVIDEKIHPNGSPGFIRCNNMYVSRACDSCRRRKIKCDADNPCAKCRGSQISCEYSYQPRQRGPRVRKSATSSEIEQTHQYPGRHVQSAESTWYERLFLVNTYTT
jgi:hypothetical protein